MKVTEYTDPVGVGYDVQNSQNSWRVWVILGRVNTPGIEINLLNSGFHVYYYYVWQRIPHSRFQRL